ncbi:MAG: PEP-CTERM sorting domain-containing protein, partial [Planctomycetales bacterium]|nr:PEP-CTERM sorting domain-containing protein [Planctomycetales bacterium]
GLWSADDVGGEILLNGTPVGNGQRGGFTNLSEFEIAGYLGDTFLPGVNTLGFQITNGGEADNPTGFRVEGLVAFARAGNGLAGDFNGNGTLDAADIDLLSAAVRNGTGGANFDLNTDGNVDDGDRQIWINDLKKTYAGDANLDGEFNSTDFVEVFQAGEYEDGVAGNSTWATGDWNGDAEFDSGDFVAAFQAGGFEQGPRAGVAAVPEPSSMLLFALGLLPLLPARRKRS